MYDRYGPHKNGSVYMEGRLLPYRQLMYWQGWNEHIFHMTFWIEFKHVLFTGKGLGMALNVTLPSPEECKIEFFCVGVVIE